jgi:SRSO17 transposase
MSEHVVGEPVDQCLQQFVNQSPWRWEPVRAALAKLAMAIQPQAWAVQEVVFPKSGASSVGVARQYDPSTGRTRNCQLGLAVLLVGRNAGCPVNWRLMLPRCWDDDPQRRTRARVPNDARYLPRWRHLLGAIDELSTAWGFRPAPVIADACEGDAQQVLRGLTGRGIPYLVKVPAYTPALPASAARRMLTVGEVAATSVARQIKLPGHDLPNGQSIVVQYSVASICDPCLARGSVSRCRHTRRRQVLAEWLPGGRRLRAVWLTNLTQECPHELVRLANLNRIRHAVTTTLRTDFGLQDFEGRSFAGWHHHVTLVSAAHTLWTLRRLQQGTVGSEGP